MRRIVFKMFVMLFFATNTMLYGQTLSDLEVSATDSVASVAVIDTINANELAVSDSLLSTYYIKTDETRTWRHSKTSPYRFKPLQLVVPITLFSVGFIGCENHWFKYQNKEIRDELQEHIGRKFAIDNISQYAPMVATYGLNLCGLKGKHGYGDLTIILGTAYALMGITVNTLKSTTRVLRPDNSSRNSFPSGHTATAFMGAELLHREYWDVSPWIGMAGYVVAAGTGFFRMYNNRHWLNDVVAGAGIGILSVEAAYWLYPVISKTFFHRRYLKNTFISPYLSDNGKGVTCVITF